MQSQPCCNDTDSVCGEIRVTPARAHRTPHLQCVLSPHTMQNTGGPPPPSSDRHEVHERLFFWISLSIYNRPRQSNGFFLFSSCVFFSCNGVGPAPMSVADAGKRETIQETRHGYQVTRAYNEHKIIKMNSVSRALWVVISCFLFCFYNHEGWNRLFVVIGEPRCAREPDKRSRETRLLPRGSQVTRPSEGFD